MKPRIPITTAGIYWILVLCGLVGTTILRREHMGELSPLWLGTVGGVALGQLAAHLRIRPLMPLLLIPASAWIVLPISFYFFAESGVSTSAATLLALSFFPSLVGGYLSLSERGGVVAFWYPVVLWMLVILDHPLDARLTAFHPQAALPFLVLLGALFVAFLRARETRRVTIWEGHGSPRLAVDARRTVLRSSPLRGALSVVWTGAIGGVALLLTWWVAPQLWLKDAQLQREESMHARPDANIAEGTLPCCESRRRTARVHEYLPISGAVDESSLSCRSCSTSHVATVATVEPPLYGTRPLYGTPTYDSGWTAGSTGTTVDPSLSPDTSQTTAVPVPAYVAPAQHPIPGTPVSAPVALAPRPVRPAGTIPGLPSERGPKPAPIAPETVGTSSGATYSSGGHAVPAYVEVSQPLGWAFPSGAPWPWMFGAAIVGVIAHVLLRMLRRTVTLAHLARPFWKEPVDQQISNHWQRMLIGLRDAGIQEGRDESPSAFARRIGIEGMETCATILERVRHGVRIEEHDVANMASGASNVFTKAQARAGLAGRAAAWLRWPLA